MNLEKFANLSAPSRPARIVAILIATSFLVLGVSEVFSPRGFDSSYGVPLVGGDELSFVRAVGARNSALSLVAIFAALCGMRAALASVFAGISLIAAMDFYIVSSAVGAEHAIKHAVFVVVLAGIAAWIALSRGRAREWAAS